VRDESGFDPNKPPVATGNLNESIHIKQSALLEIQQRHEQGNGMDHSLMRIFGENKLKVGAAVVFEPPFSQHLPTPTRVAPRLKGHGGLI
jgi:hypothetical protein